MTPRVSLRTERVLTRTGARLRPTPQSPLQPRDKRPQYEIRHIAARYDVTMSQAHDTLEEREAQMAAWLTSVAKEKKRLYGWTTEETIERSSIDRASWYRWKRISKPGNTPRPQKLDEFCESLGLDPAIPYGILGWGRPAERRPQPKPEPEPESEIDRRIRLLRIAIDRPGIKPEERQELEVLLVRLLAEQRSMDDAIKATDKALKRHRAA
jgi:hypothetical protein